MQVLTLRLGEPQPWLMQRRRSSASAARPVPKPKVVRRGEGGEGKLEDWWGRLVGWKPVCRSRLEPLDGGWE